MEMTAIILRANDSGKPDNPKRLIADAQRIFRAGLELRRSRPTDAEKTCRDALAKLRDAYLLTKAPNTMRLLHRYGKRVKEAFRCELAFTKHYYRQTCPVALSHLKHGVSPGITGTLICSICAKNTLDCNHRSGHIYNNVPAVNISGHCNICRKKKCNHVGGQTYDSVHAGGIMTDMRPDHIAVVENPKDPLAAITSISLEKEEVMKPLTAAERPFFVYGETRVYCEHCRGCDGRPANSSEESSEISMSHGGEPEN